MALLIIEFIG